MINLFNCNQWRCIHVTQRLNGLHANLFGNNRLEVNPCKKISTEQKVGRVLELEIVCVVTEDV